MRQLWLGGRELRRRRWRRIDDLLVEEPAPAPPTPGRPPFPSSTPPQDQGSVLMAGGPDQLPRLEAPSHSGPTGNRPPLASPRLATLLALALRPPTGPASIESRGSGTDRHHGEREPALGHRAYPRRAPQARHRGQFPLCRLRKSPASVGRTMRSNSSILTGSPMRSDGVLPSYRTPCGVQVFIQQPSSARVSTREAIRRASRDI